MTRLVEAALARPRACVALAMALTAVLGAGLARLELRTDGDSIYPDHNRVVDRTRADANRGGARCRLDSPQRRLWPAPDRGGSQARPRHPRRVRGRRHAAAQELPPARGGEARGQDPGG